MSDFKEYRVATRPVEALLPCLVAMLASSLVCTTILVIFYLIVFGEALSQAAMNGYAAVALSHVIFVFPTSYILFVKDVRGDANFVRWFAIISVIVAILFIGTQIVTGRYVPYMEMAISTFGPDLGVFIGAAISFTWVALLSAVTAVINRRLATIVIRFNRYGTVHPPTIEQVVKFYKATNKAVKVGK